MTRAGGVGERAGGCRRFMTNAEAGAAGVGCVLLRLRPRVLSDISVAGFVEGPAFDGPASGTY